MRGVKQRQKSILRKVVREARREERGEVKENKPETPESNSTPQSPADFIHQAHRSLLSSLKGGSEDRRLPIMKPPGRGKH